MGAKETVQVGIQNNINNVQVGLTPSNAVEMALGIFREHYPQLKQEALAEVKQLVIEEMKKIQPEDPLNINLYFDNLIRLGLLERSPAFSSLTDKTLYESLKTHPYIVTKKESIHQYAEPYNQPAFSEGYMSLTDFGREFCEKTVIEIVTIHLPPIQL